jgi:hypothetical protein
MNKYKHESIQKLSIHIESSVLQHTSDEQHDQQQHDNDHQPSIRISPTSNIITQSKYIEQNEITIEIPTSSSESIYTLKNNPLATANLWSIWFISFVSGK